MSIQDHHALTPRAIEGFRRREIRRREKLKQRRFEISAAGLSARIRFALSRLLSDDGLGRVSRARFGRPFDCPGLKSITRDCIRKMRSLGLIKIRRKKREPFVYLSSRGRAIAEGLEREAGE